MEERWFNSTGWKKNELENSWRFVDFITAHEKLAPDAPILKWNFTTRCQKQHTTIHVSKLAMLSYEFVEGRWVSSKEGNKRPFSL